MTVETDNVLSAIRRGEDSLPKLRAATGLEYAKLHPILHVLEFEDRSIQRNENADGFDRYTPMPAERNGGSKGAHWKEESQTAMPVTPQALHSTRAAADAREMALLQRNAPYCVGCRGLCVLHGTDRTGKIRWRCRTCEMSFAGSGAVRDLNRLAPEKREAAISAFNEAKSVRKVAAEVGIAPATAAKIRDEEKIEALCPCGQDAKHKGWCAHRFQNSPARQATVEKMNMAHIDPHEEAEKKIAAMIERGKAPRVDLAATDATEQAKRNLDIAEPRCGCGYTANHRGRCADGQLKSARQDSVLTHCEKCGASLAGQTRVNMNRCAECWTKYLKQCAARRKAEQNGHSPKIDENITETITAEGQVSENSRNVHSCGFPAVGSKNGTNPETESAQQERAQVVTPDISESKILSIAENSPINDGSKTGNGHEPTAEALLKMIAEKEAQITILQDDIVALRRVADILQT